jgi:glycosyltransferase involved in cell wall biosynthesis
MSAHDTAEAAAATPLVSILVPAYNAGTWIAEAIESATRQTYEHVEIIVADNASTDETVEIARACADPRLRIHESPVNTGLVGNHNLLARISRGRYLKFLHADDRLYPDCVESMVSLATTNADVGLVFAPREILATGPDADSWIAEFGRPHEHFGGLEPVNDGRTLMWQLLDAGFDNWIGEPSAVLVSRRALEAVGLFNPRLRQISDLELWLRIALRFRLGFLDRTLCAYRHHDRSASAESAATNDDWLDPVWLAESLLVANRGGPEHRRLASLRNRRLLQALKNQALRGAHGRFDMGLIDYCRYRARREHGRSTLHPPLG